MRPALGALGLLLLACRSQPAAELGRDLMAVAGEQGETEARRHEAEQELGRIVRKVQAAASSKARVDALNAVVFGELAFEREVDHPDAATMLLPPVLRHRRGTCVGLGTLYLAVAERLGWPAHAVLVPGHFFVRVDEGGRWRNVELLRRGEQMPESWYRQKYGPPAGGAYLRALSPAEVRAVLYFNLGNQQREAGRLPEAEAAYRRATGDFPGFPEAHASLGLTLHLRGRLPEARRAYQDAARLHPALPGLAKNLAKLDQELASAAAR